MHKFLVRFLVLCLASGALSFAHAPESRAATMGDSFSLSPFWDWKTIETEHFRVTFPKELEAQAQKTSAYFEQAHRALSPELLWSPRTKTQVLLTDHTDSANGLASPMSRLGIMLYLTPPDAHFSTNYYDDWLKLLVFHEYTHYLNMDPTHGFYAAFRVLFGDVLLPNALWPSWMLEGLAVYMETKYTARGRGRSPYYEAVLRSLVASDGLGNASGITLDRVNGTNPRYPGGETPYLFGYYLMNEVGQSKPGALGEMSIRSSQRVPYFINGNLENVTGKDWYAFWDQFVAKTRARASADLEKIRVAGETKFEPVDGTEYDSIGSAVSANDEWLAYSNSSTENWQKLFLKNLKSGESEALEDKFIGSSMAFTPDSKFLVFSSLHRRRNYYFLSDLKAYDIARDKSYWLTDRLRARDPDVSRDGKWVVFTTAVKSGTHLNLAKLRVAGDRLVLEGKRTIVEAAMFDRISNPKFSPDQKSVVFSLKKNGALGEDLMRYDFPSGKSETLVSDQSMNRYPAFDRNGLLHYVSDRTGVDNLYRFTGSNSLQVTNFAGAVYLPTFSATKAYGSVLTAKGWSLAAFEPSAAAYSSAAVTISKPEAPETVDSQPELKTYAVEDYSIFPSILPRQWAPILLLTKDGGYVGGQVFGYDAVMRHQYLFAGAYDTEFKQFDALALYSNRSFGPTLDLFYARQLGDRIYAADVASGIPSYRQKTSAGASLSFPFQGTTSILTPSLGLGIERDSYYDGVAGAKVLTGKSRFVPTVDALLTYSNTRSSRLAVTAERGRRLILGVRRYNDSDRENYKAIAKNAEYWNLGDHVVLSPSLKGVMVSKRNSRYLDANAVIRGREDRIVNPLPSDNFDEIGIRGYPYLLATSRKFVTGALDLNFPVAQIFRGWGTNPVFFDQLTMNLFGELTYAPDYIPEARKLGSVGAGLRLSSDWLLHIPLTFAVDYHHGFNELVGTGGEAFFSVNFTGALPF